MLFPELGVKGLSGRLDARRGALGDRVVAVKALTSGKEQWIVWCGLNIEAQALMAALDGAVNVQGSDSYSEKVGAVKAFCDGAIRVLVTKPTILGFGMNFQHCSRMVFCGLSDSYESYYQCVRRCWRYGQARPVDAWLVVSEAERGIVRNVHAKELRAEALSGMLLKHMSTIERESLCA